ncbi:MAG TPA: HEAT repeat domain-containing protein [Terriglobia bacterium]|jgi:HEAT repeat protein|nr:HEAT repeat domain-containing protein [Terriglobia bacterium]
MKIHGSNRMALAGALILLGAALAAAQNPSIVNGSVQKRAAASGLGAEFGTLVKAQTTPAWIGYGVPAVNGAYEACCNGGDHDGSVRFCGQCRLEDGNYSSNISSESRTANLETPDLLVLFRVENGAVEKIRMFSEDCELDAGGRTVYWLTGVSPQESVALLASMVTGTTGSGGGLENSEDADRVSDGALAAIAMHAAPEADAALKRFVTPEQPEKLRERAAFWMASARGKTGFETIRSLARDDRDDRFREKLMFDLSVSKQPEGVDALIDSAHHDPSAPVRGQAIFWLAQKAGKRAEGVITEAIERDPNTEVKKKAVFALSQLPKDEGVPLLIEAARSNSNPVVRKDAMFWLGQSNDPRALEFFEQVLGQR